MDLVPENKIYEMPVAEDLMTGIATGMALEGYLPVLIFERQDFMLIASDQIINHLSKINELSNGEFNPKVIIRAIVGHNKPFDPGPQHLQDFTDFFKRHCSFPVIACLDIDQIKKTYKDALERDQSTMIVEYKELY
jgi:pyruvate dehydrogenase E1 component beta subunit